MRLCGYPKVKPLQPHVLRVEVRPAEVPLMGEAKRSDFHAGRVTKHFLRAEGGEAPTGLGDLLLLNLLTSRPGDDLYSVLSVFQRLESLSHILVWSRVRIGTNFAVDRVELPRLQLAFETKVDQ